MGKQPKPAIVQVEPQQTAKPQLQFIDYGVVPVAVDTVTECRAQNGLACISLGASSRDGDAQPRVVIAGRYRMSLPFLKKFHADIGRLIASAQEPTGAKN